MTASFATGGDRTRYAVASLAAAGVVSVLLPIVHALASGSSGLSASGAIEGVLLVVGDLLQMITVAAFGIWLHRAYSNVAALRPPTRYTAAAAVAFFYLPFVSLFLPQAVFQEVWIKSRVDDPRARSAPIRQTRSPWFETWWYLFIAFSALYNYGGKLALGNPEESARATGILFLSGAFGFGVALLGIDLIRKVDHRQQTSILIAALPGAERRPVFHERRSALRDLIVPIVSMVEAEKTAPEEESSPRVEIPPAVLQTAAASRTAAIRVGRWAIKPRIPPLRQFTFGSVFVTVLAIIIQLISAFQILYCVVGLAPNIDRSVENIYLVTAFLGPPALLQYLFCIIAYVTWKFWNRSSAREETLQRFRSASMHAAIIFGVVLLLAIVMPPKVTYLALAAANVFVVIAGRALRQVAFSVAWNRPARVSELSPSGQLAADHQEPSLR